MKDKKDLPTIKTLWIGELSRVETTCLNSFINSGHTVELFSYSKISNLPIGVIEKDANEILPENKIFRYGSINNEGKGSVAGFANHFRYLLLYQSENTFWVDADVLCVKPFKIEKDLIFGWENSKHVNNAVIGTKKKFHPIFKNLVSYCEHPFQLKKWDDYKIFLKKIYGNYIKGGSSDYIPWGLTGPIALTGYIKLLKLHEFAVEKHFFYPIESLDWKKCFFSDKSNLQIENSFFIHLWNEQLRREHINKNQIFNPNSIFEFYARSFS